MKLAALIALLSATGLVGTAFAQQGGGKATPAGGAAAGDSVQYKQKTVYDFEDDMVEGDLQRPDGELVNSLRKTQHASLITIRPDFIPEMLKSLEDL
jgi:hypothetical protein